MIPHPVVVVVTVSSTTLKSVPVGMYDTTDTFFPEIVLGFATGVYPGWYSTARSSTTRLQVVRDGIPRPVASGTGWDTTAYE